LFDNPYSTTGIRYPAGIQFWNNKYQAELNKADQGIRLTENKPRGYLSSEDLPNIVPDLFYDSSVLYSKLKRLEAPFDPESDTEETRVIHLQTGVKAYIFLMESWSASSPSESVFFVTYLSRGHSFTNIGQQAESDFNNLQRLSSLAERRIIDPTTKEKYKFIRPFAQGKSGKYTGFTYPYFTAPFIDGYGELRLNSRIVDYVTVRDQSGGSGTGVIAIPYFSYAGPPTDDYRSAHYNLSSHVDAVHTYASDILSRNPSKILTEEEYSQVYEDLYQLPYIQFVQKQLLDVLAGSALIFILTDRRFPREFAINTGDWMAIINNYGLDLYLTTVRGGWQQYRSDDEWISAMQAHRDYAGDEGGSPLPFNSFTRESFKIF